MKQVGSYEAKTKLPYLLTLVESGEIIEITRHGHPVAQLTPLGKKKRRPAKELVKEVQKLRKKQKKPFRRRGESWKDIIHAGHKY